MTTDRTYLMAGSIAHRLNEALPTTATVLEADLDTERDMVHVRCVISRNGVVSVGASGAELYFGITDTAITSTVENDGYTSPRKVFTNNTYMGDSAWAQLACDYITSEVNHFIDCNRGAPQPTINDLAKAEAESSERVLW
jgi:hypothetical protein